MAAPTRQKGLDVTQVQGPGFEFVGAFSAAVIDQQTEAETPSSPADRALIWIKSLLATNGIAPEGLTDELVISANCAQRYWLFIYYWERSKVADNCPEACKDPDQYYRNLNWARKEMCICLSALGVTDPAFCKEDQGAPDNKNKAWKSLVLNTCN